MKAQPYPVLLFVVIQWEPSQLFYSSAKLSIGEEHEKTIFLCLFWGKEAAVLLCFCKSLYGNVMGIPHYNISVYK